MSTAYNHRKKALGKLPGWGKKQQRDTPPLRRPAVRGPRQGKRKEKP